MKKTALLVDYSMCDGCQRCVKACCREHGWKEAQSGIVLSHVGPYRFPSGKEEAYYIAAPTDFCDCCEEGNGPACVSACPKRCLEIGDLQDLGKRLTGKKMAMFTLINRTVAWEETK